MTRRACQRSARAIVALSTLAAPAIVVGSCGGEAAYEEGIVAPDAQQADLPGDAPPSGVRDQSCAEQVQGRGTGCGASNESCCTALTVSGGTFGIGVTSPTFGFSGSTATVSPFLLEKYEITVGRFRAFVDALGKWTPRVGDGAHPAIAGSGWQADWPAPDGATIRAGLTACGGTWTADPGANERKPISCITWFELFAFCIWDGGRIPTMVERTYAAYGGDDERQYPWSAADGGTDAPVEDGRAVDSPEGGTPRAGPQEVGSLPLGAGRWGQLDLAGNVAEWVLDRNPPDPFPNAHAGERCTDCALLGTRDQDRINQGGSYASPDLEMHSWWINYAAPSARLPTVGGRCVK